MTSMKWPLLPSSMTSVHPSSEKNKSVIQLTENNLINEQYKPLNLCLTGAGCTDPAPQNNPLLIAGHFYKQTNNSRSKSKGYITTVRYLVMKN